MPHQLDQQLEEARRLRDSGDFDAARRICTGLLAAAPDHILVMRLLAAIDLAAGRPHAALATQQALAQALEAEGDRPAAIEALRETCVTHAADPQAWRRLAHTLFRHGDRAGALAAFQAVVRLAPEDARSHANIGMIFRSAGRHLDAIESLERAAALDGSDADLVMALASAEKRLGFDQRAFARFARISAWIEAVPSRRSEYLFSLLQSNLPAQQVYAAHVAYGDAFAGVAPLVAHRRPRDGVRRLKLGYVSGDFRQHVMADYIVPVLERHDRGAFEVFAYSQAARADAVTDRIKGLVDHWRPIRALDDLACARRIAEDGIDILVDLSGHTGGNRLPVFAHRPAPVQASWLGYPGTTGMTQIDYRISDPYLAGPQTQAFVRERLILLPRVSAAHRRLPDVPVAPPPNQAAGHITFGSTNSAAKINTEVIAAWSAILSQVPNSRLLLKAHGFEDPRFQPVVRERFAAHGLDPGRLDFEGFEARDNYLHSHARIDIVLDSFPYTGGTTTRSALWMGTPVVTLEGRALHERVSSAMLRVLGLDDCIANGADEYVAKAVALAADPARLAALRGEIRPRLLSTALFDPGGATADLEDAYRAMWRAWLESPARPLPSTRPIG